MTVLWAILLGCAIGSTFTLLLLKGARTASDERPTTAFMRVSGKPIDVARFESYELTRGAR